MPTPSVPAFLIVVNQSNTVGLVEYSLPLAMGENPLYTLPPAGTYQGGVPVQNDLFVFGLDPSNTPTLWRYTLPLSQSPSPAAFQVSSGQPVAALSIAGGQFVLFLEKTSSGGACLEGYTAGSLIDASPPTLPAPTLTCQAGLLSGSGTFLGGTIQVSADGSSLFVETTYASTSGTKQTTEQSYPAGPVVNGSLPAPSATYQLSPVLFTLPIEGAVESNNVLLLLPDPSVPAVDFYPITSARNGSGTLQPLTSNTVSITQSPTLLAIDPFGSLLYMAAPNPGGGATSLWAFSLTALQNGSNVSPISQSGAGLHPVALLPVVGTQG
ncbi:MAG: hypothetical protein ACYC9S_02800 [Leptospirales bacterium]